MCQQHSSCLWLADTLIKFTLIRSSALETTKPWLAINKEMCGQIFVSSGHLPNAFNWFSWAFNLSTAQLVNQGILGRRLCKQLSLISMFMYRNLRITKHSNQTLDFRNDARCCGLLIWKRLETRVVESREPHSVPKLFPRSVSGF